MAKIGKIKGSLEQEDDGKLILTSEEAGELATLLNEADGVASDVSNEKVDGTVILEILNGKISVSTGKVKKESIDDEDAE